VCVRAHAEYPGQPGSLLPATAQQSGGGSLALISEACLCCALTVWHAVCALVDVTVHVHACVCEYKCACVCRLWTASQPGLLCSALHTLVMRWRASRAPAGAFLRCVLSRQAKWQSSPGGAPVLNLSVQPAQALNTCPHHPVCVCTGPQPLTSAEAHATVGSKATSVCLSQSIRKRTRAHTHTPAALCAMCRL